MSGRSLSQEGPKYRQILDRLAKDIASGKYAPGQKLPSEAALVRLYGASRITVGRAVHELKELGLVHRIAGSGTYVRNRAGDGAPLFGLLIPDLGETEIFEPICRGMANAPKQSEYGLLWGRTAAAGATKEEQAWSLCQQFIERRVAGVFFAPLEITATRRSANDSVVKALDKAQIPVVLLDRCIFPFPKRSRYDLVGINNRRAGYLATDHLVRQSCRRILFLADVSITSTVEARMVGFREALLANGLAVDRRLVQALPAENGALQKMLNKFRPEGFVCVNDRTAGRLMQSLLSLGYRIPQDFKIVGIDDVEYAKLLPVPLTTIHQPCREIGHAAMAAMFERIKHPDMLTRDILLECELVIRSSCGSAPLPSAQPAQE